MIELPSLSQAMTIALAVFGVAWIIADSKISLPVRRFVAKQLGDASLFLMLLECPPYLSFWLGLGAAFLVNQPWLAVVLAPLCTAVSLLLWTYVERKDSDE
jgi:hypothetical protein